MNIQNRIVYAAAVILTLTFVDCKRSDEPSSVPVLKPGDLWMYEYIYTGEITPDKSPFQDCTTEYFGTVAERISITYRILDVKDGWVKYEKVGKQTAHPECDKIYRFLIGARKISP